MRLRRVLAACTGVLLLAAREAPSSMRVRLERRHGSSQAEASGVESRRLRQVRFSISSVPLFEIGGLEESGATELSTNFARVSAVFLPSGGIAIGDVTRVLFVDARGGITGTTGRAGGGPGEYREIAALCATHNDTIAVADAGQRRITILAVPGRVVRSFQHEINHALSAHGCFADGRVLTVRYQDLSNRTSRMIPVELDLSGRATREWAPIESAQIADVITQPRVSLVTDGRTVYFADGLRSEVQVLNRRGDQVRRIVTGTPLSPVTNDERTKALDRTIPRNVTGAARDAIIARELRREARPTWPTMGRLLPDRSGRLWIQRYRKASERGPFSADEWLAVDSTGRAIGRLALPASVLRDRPASELLDVLGDRVLLKRVDDNGAVRVAVHRLLTR